MSWLEASNWANIAKATAKTAVKYAQKNIDKVLEIPEIKTDHDELNDESITQTSNGNGRSTPVTRPDIKEESEGFFSLFGVKDPSTESKKSKNSSENSAIGPERPDSRLNASPAISRVTSSTSLYGLHLTEGWNSSEIHPLSHSEPASFVTTSRNPEDRQQTLPDISATAIASLQSINSFTSLHSASQERLLAFSRSTDGLDTLDSVPEFLPSQIPQGRLEILFHDEDPVEISSQHSDGLVEVSLVSSAEEFIPEQPGEVEKNSQKSNDAINQSMEGLHDNLDAPLENQFQDKFLLTETSSGEINHHTDVCVVRSSKDFEEENLRNGSPKPSKSSGPVYQTTTFQPLELSEMDLTGIPSFDFSSGEAIGEDYSLNIGSDSLNLSAALSETQSSRQTGRQELNIKDGVTMEEKIDLPSSDLGKELEHLRSILASREQKLLDVSRENAQLKEINDNLSSQILDLRSTQSDSEKLKQEFSDRLAVMERKLQLVSEEKKSLMEQLQLAKAELSNNVRAKQDVSAIQARDLLRKLEEKEQQVKELMEEGDKLSKQQLQSSTHIKKLKARQKELEAENTKLRSELEERTTEVATLKSTLSVAEDLDKKNNSMTRQLSSTIERLEKDLAVARNLHEEARAKMSSMQAALDSAYKELADLHRQKATQESHVHEALLTTELAAKEELRQALEQQKQDLIRSQEDLIDRLQVLQTSLTRAEATLKRKEEAQRQEVADYQQRLQDSMTRNEELSQNLTQATRPLLRQNEALQRQIAEQSATFDQLERNLTKRLQEASTQFALAQAKERDAIDRLTIITGKTDALESQMSSIREERSGLAAEVDLERRKARELEEKLISVRNEAEKQRAISATELSALLREKQLLDHQMALQQENLSMEQRKTLALTEQMADLQRLTRSNLVQSDSAAALKRSDSVNSTSSTLDGRWSPTSQQTNSLYDVLRGGSAPFLDSVQSQLRLKEGEILHLKTQLKQLEVTRQKNTEELIQLTEKTQELDKLRAEVDSVQSSKEELSRRYHAMLQMYGEKAEELQELRLDYEDMKALYKSQIDSLAPQH